MNRDPLFHRQSKKIKASDFLRNTFCDHYETCLDEAARKDQLLDCGSCDYNFSYYQYNGPDEVH